jgi:hypothetical protein
MFDAVVSRTPNVHDTVSEVADTNVVAPQLPLVSTLTTEAAVKPVPVRVKALVAPASPVDGDTLVMVGPASMVIGNW